MHTNNQPQLDPDPIAVLGVIISGLSLLLALESKIEARHARLEAKSDIAKRACRASLRNLQRDCFQISEFIRSFRRLGDIEQVESREKGFGAFRLYFSDEQLADYNQNFDSIMQAVSSINRSVIAMPLQDIPLRPMEKFNLVKAINSIRISANTFFSNPIPEEGISAAIAMSQSAASLMRQIERIIDIEPPTQTNTLEIDL